MPLYDYQCDKCNHVFEVTKKFSDPGPDACPKCGAANPRRAISATSFQLKGSGWYVTDYKGSNPSVAPATSSDTSSSDSSSSDKASASDASSASSDSKEPAPGKREVA